MHGVNLVKGMITGQKAIMTAKQGVAAPTRGR